MDGLSVPLKDFMEQPEGDQDVLCRAAASVERGPAELALLVNVVATRLLPRHPEARLLLGNLPR